MEGAARVCAVLLPVGCCVHGGVANTIERSSAVAELDFAPECGEFSLDPPVSYCSEFVYVDEIPCRKDFLLLALDQEASPALYWGGEQSMDVKMAVELLDMAETMLRKDPLVAFALCTGVGVAGSAEIAERVADCRGRSFVGIGRLQVVVKMDMYGMDERNSGVMFDGKLINLRAAERGFWTRPGKHRVEANVCGKTYGEDTVQVVAGESKAVEVRVEF